MRDLELGDRSVIVLARQQDAPTHKMSECIALIEIHCLPGNGDRGVQVVVGRLCVKVHHGQHHGVREPGMRLGKRGIELDGPAQQLLRFAIVRRRGAEQVLHAEQEVIPGPAGLRRLPLGARAFGAGDLRFDAGRDERDDFIVGLVQVFLAPIELLGPDATAGFSLRELHGDAHAVSRRTSRPLPRRSLPPAAVPIRRTSARCALSAKLVSRATTSRVRCFDSAVITSSAMASAIGLPSAPVPRISSGITATLGLPPSAGTAAAACRRVACVGMLTPCRPMRAMKKALDSDRALV